MNNAAGSSEPERQLIAGGRGLESHPAATLAQRANLAWHCWVRQARWVKGNEGWRLVYPPMRLLTMLNVSLPCQLR